MDITDEWAADGPAEDLQRVKTLPGFIETAPGVFEAVGNCTAAQLRALGDAKLLEARALMDEARTLYEYADRL